MPKFLEKLKLSKIRPTKEIQPPIQPNRPSPPNDLRPDINPAPNLEPAIDPGKLQIRLWNEAYEEIKLESPHLVETYEKILSSDLPHDLQESSAPAIPQNRINAAHNERWKQMQTIVETVSERTKRKVAKKKKTGHGLTAVSAAMNQAVRLIPEASIAWTGVCFALEVGPRA